MTSCQQNVSRRLRRCCPHVRRQLTLAQPSAQPRPMWCGCLVDPCLMMVMHLEAPCHFLTDCAASSRLCYFSQNHCDGPTSNTFAATERTEAFGSTALYGDVGACRSAEALLHFVSPRRQLRLLANNRAVDVADHPTSLSD